MISPSRHLFFLLLLAILCAPLPASGESAAESRRQLEEIERRIRETAASLKKKEATAHSLETELASVEKATARLGERVAALEREAGRLREELTAKSREIGELQVSVTRTEALVRRRLVALYKTGEAGPLRVFFAGGSPARAAENYDFLGRIVRRDRELLSDYRRQLREMEEAKKELSELQRKQESALAELQSEQENLRRAMRLKTGLLAQAQQEQTTLSGQLKDLRERARRVNALIAKLEAERLKKLEAERKKLQAERKKKSGSERLKRLESEKTPKYTQKVVKDGPFARQRGRLPWPAAGAVRVPFGTSRHSDLGTLRESQGIEIGTPPEGQVSAVWPGFVVFANEFKGFGNMVIVDHGDGFYTLYAQASRLARRVGEQVKAGEVLAFSGEEGAYFEIRYHGSPLNPAEWLAPR